jgi:preprotein translocase subunit SecA
LQPQNTKKMANILEKLLTSILGSKNDRELKKMESLVQETNVEYEKLKSLSNDELRGKTEEFKQRIREFLQEYDNNIEEILQEAEAEEDLHAKESLFSKIDSLRKERLTQLEVALAELLPEAFAVVKESAYRFANNAEIKAKATELDRLMATKNPSITIESDTVTYRNEWKAAGNTVKWNMVHYDVQLIGGIVLHQGKISEMATGEGKTLVATLPAYLNALSGEGVHIVTVNDYLARRDAEWNGPLFNFLGLRVDCIDLYQPHSEARKNAYRADITYGTNNEFGFDYLRDNMVNHPDEMVQRKHHFAMVDEVDSVLIDDARTPLIISGQVDSNDEAQFFELKPRITKLFETQKRICSQYLTDAKRLIKEGNTGYKEGEGGMALYRSFRGWPRNSALIKYLSESGVMQVMREAENHFLAEQQKNMPFVDKELYFTIDEKNNSVDLADKGIELITGAGEDHNFFVIPDVGAAVAEIEKAGLSAEEKLERKEKLMAEFGVKTERIHTVQQLLKAYTLFEADIQYVVMDGKVKIVDENTGRILDGRRYSDGLHQAIEAKENVKIEAASQTMATITLQNYFRMFHKLCGMTGTAVTEAGEFWDIYKLDVMTIPTNRPIVRDDREDLIYKTKREKYNAIIDEIVTLTEAGRPVLVGTTNVEVSELLGRMLTIRKIKHNVLNAKHHQREAEIVEQAGFASAVTIATNMAGRGTDIKISEEVKKAGGLAIIGSERHDSRRVDRQLRGRAGRQGDPGSSQFYVSLEDDLMRLFGSERISKVMDRLGYKDGEVIQHSMVTKSIERAQKKVEENNFGIRKRLLEYDDVMNRQRGVIYGKRKHALFGERLSLDIQNSLYDLSEEIVSKHLAVKDYESFELEVIKYFAFSTSINKQSFDKDSMESLTETLFEEVMTQYKKKKDAVVAQAVPVLKNIHRERGSVIQNIAIPFSEGKKGMNIVVSLHETVTNEGKYLWKSFEKNVSLAFIDEAWKHHLRMMDDLKQEVQTAHFEQKDPLVIYKIESFNLFKNLLSQINGGIASFLFKGELPNQEQTQRDVKEAKILQTDLSKMQTNKADVDEMGNPGDVPVHERKQIPVVRDEIKIGRNDPCPCGSGKKFKQCHGKEQ